MWTVRAESDDFDAAWPRVGRPVIHWSLDNLGNWNQRGASDFPEIPSVSHTTAPGNNQLDQIITPGATPSNQAIINDLNGNIAFDGDYFYQYDAWNRLIQVNKPGTAVFTNWGQVSSGDLADLVARFQYDGVGRLIVKETPVTTGTTALQIKHYYYDGVRRIQEVIDRPDPLRQPTNCCMPFVGCYLVDYNEACTEFGGTLLQPGQDCDQCYSGMLSCRRRLHG